MHAKEYMLYCNNCGTTYWGKYEDSPCPECNSDDVEKAFECVACEGYFPESSLAPRLSIDDDEDILMCNSCFEVMQRCIDEDNDTDEE